MLPVTPVTADSAAPLVCYAVSVPVDEYTAHALAVTNVTVTLARRLVAQAASVAVRHRAHVRRSRAWQRRRDCAI